MAFYRNKPVVVEAVQWTGANKDEMSGFIGRDHTDNYVTGSTLWFNVCEEEGYEAVMVGEWLVRVGSSITKMTDKEFSNIYDSISERVF